MRDSHSFFYLQLRVFDSVFVVPALALQANRLLWLAPPPRLLCSATAFVVYPSCPATPPPG
ncbi:hypothetical protein CBM2599_A30191 [Cupriavidus taiwanensis]|nr:hypothetical protein CBM2599_A30191 [Cupriavidus taiwanensis]SOY88839.1 hypothetical protein CBM2600_A40095 [Cupriavidus taiwanensis]